MMAIKKSGILKYKIQIGAYNGTLFIDFLQTLVQHFTDNPNDWLVMDNCRFHRRGDVIMFLDQNNIRYKFLPPYSPQLNPIEEYFSFIKSKYRTMRPLSRNNNDIAEKIEIIANIENINFSVWYDNMRRWLNRASARQEF
jgi:transposase